VASLDPVTVFGTPSPPSLFVREFLDRRRRGGFGRFLTAEDLERSHPTQVSAALGRVPGLVIAPGPYGNAILGSGKAGVGSCKALVAVNGTALQPDDVVDQFVGPQDVAGVEVYADPTYAPPQYAGPRTGGCSVVLVWTRH